MKRVCVITGGSGGMGLETARVMGGDYHIIIADISKDGLERAVKDLRRGGVTAEAHYCDVTDKDGVGRLARYAGKRGEVKAVVHVAGISPNMADAEKIIAVNAVGTVNINNAFHKVMKKGSCLIDVASMAAHMIPGFICPRSAYPLCRTDMEAFRSRMMRRMRLIPKKQRSGFAYAVSKDFIIWLAKKDAARFGEKGIRVLSVSPGNFDTPMGEIEKELAGPLINRCAIKRYGKTSEIAHLFAACADERIGYLTGTDILIDGGMIASGVRP